MLLLQVYALKGVILAFRFSYVENLTVKHLDTGIIPPEREQLYPAHTA